MVACSNHAPPFSSWLSYPVVPHKLFSGCLACHLAMRLRIPWTWHRITRAPRSLRCTGSSYTSNALLLLPNSRGLQGGLGIQHLVPQQIGTVSEDEAENITRRAPLSPVASSAEVAALASKPAPSHFLQRMAYVKYRRIRHVLHPPRIYVVDTSMKTGDSH